jgi:hypothetical protein
LDDGDGGARDAADERELADERDGRDVVRAARGEWGEFVFILLVVHAAISVDTRVARGRGGDVRAFDFRAVSADDDDDSDVGVRERERGS